MTYRDSVKLVRGKKKGNIFLFALSTCGWCAMTKQFFNDLGFEYSYVDVDFLDDKSQAEVDKELKKYKTDMSFPKIIINNVVISGFNEEAIRVEIEKWKN